MEHAAALLLLIGCTDDFSQCRELAAPTTFYQTKAECDRALPSSLGAFMGQFEQLYAQCIPVDPDRERQAKAIWKILPDSTLIASAEPADVMVASNSQPRGEDGYLEHQ
jgi:hypothetical protein